MPGYFLVSIFSRAPDKSKRSMGRIREVIRQREPVGVGVAAHPSAVTGLRDTQHPLDQLPEVRLITPRHAQPKVPRIRVHAR